MKATEVSKEIRKAVKKLYPGVKFTVRTEHSTSVRINWFDGPTAKEMESHFGHMKAGTFNGMIDLYEYNGDRQYDNLYIFFIRHNSPEFLQKCVDKFVTEFGYDYSPEIKVGSWDGGAFLPDSSEFVSGSRNDLYWRYDKVVERIARETSAL